MFVQIPGFPDYLVNDQGVVASTKKGKWRILTPTPDRAGYLGVCLSVDGKKHNLLVHRLVALTWLGSSSLQVNHENGVKSDNRLSNLKYATPSENIQHGYNAGLMEKTRESAKRMGSAKGEDSGGAKLSDAQVLELLKLKGRASQREAAKLFNISQRQVGRIWRGLSRRKE